MRGASGGAPARMPPVDRREAGGGDLGEGLLSGADRDPTGSSSVRTAGKERSPLLAPCEALRVRGEFWSGVGEGSSSAAVARRGVGAPALRRRGRRLGTPAKIGVNGEECGAVASAAPLTPASTDARVLT